MYRLPVNRWPGDAPPKRGGAKTWRWLEDFAADVRFGLRMLRKNPGFTATAVLTLALGIGANAAMFSIVNAWLLRPLPLKNPQELVSVWRTRSEAPRQPAYFILYHDYLAWSSQNGSFQSLAATFQQDYALTNTADPEQLHGAVASWNLFETIGEQAAMGRVFEADDAEREPTCVISHRLWTDEFHSARDIIGQLIRLNRKPYRVLGVLPRNFSVRVLDRAFETDVWVLIRHNDANYSPTAFSPVAVIGRLKNGVTAAQAQGDLSTLQARLDSQFSDEPQDSGVLVVDLQQDNARTIRSSLLLLFGAVGVLLLIACVNTASLTLGRNAQRAGEFAVRVSLGCGTRRLLRQLTAETLTIFVFGGGVGLILAFGLLRMFAAWNPFAVLPPGGISLDATVLAATAAVVCLTGLLFGSIPALRALRVGEQDALHTSSSRATSPREQLRWRNLFVAIEISLSVVLLASASLLISTFIKIDSEPLGFQMRDVLVGTIALPNAAYGANQEQTRFSQQVLQRLLGVPGVQAVGAALSWPFNVDGLTALETEKQQGQPIQQLPQAATFDVSPGYFDALGIPLLRGRTFDDHDLPRSAPVAVISDEMARMYFPGEDPIGKRIRFRYIDQSTPKEPWLTIVGVVGTTRSVRYNQIQWDRYPAAYRSFFQRPDEPSSPDDAGTQTVYFYIQGSPLPSASVIAATIHEIDADLPLGSLKTTSEIVSAARSQPRVRAILLGGFGGLTLLLAAIGIGGVMAQVVEHRRRDIGIRMALGALASDVQRLIMGHAIKLALWGMASGLLAAVIAARLLRGFLFGVSTVDPIAFGAVIAILSIVALLAAYIPVRQAAKLDLISTLRDE